MSRHQTPSRSSNKVGGGIGREELNMKNLIAAFAVFVCFVGGCALEATQSQDELASSAPDITPSTYRQTNCPVIQGCGGDGEPGGGGGGGPSTCGGWCDPRLPDVCTSQCGRLAHCHVLGEDSGFCEAR